MFHELQMQGITVKVINSYCPTGGHSNAEAAQQTDDPLAAVVAEIAMHNEMPTCISGDLNADPTDIPTICTLLKIEGWVDCGAIASNGVAAITPQHAKHQMQRRPTDEILYLSIRNLLRSLKVSS